MVALVHGHGRFSHADTGGVADASNPRLINAALTLSFFNQTTFAFYFPYYSNKRIVVPPSLRLSRHDTIVGPFCGSFALSLYCFHTLGLKDKRYVMCDNDVSLVVFLRDIRVRAAHVHWWQHVRNPTNKCTIDILQVKAPLRPLNPQQQELLSMH